MKKTKAKIGGFCFFLNVENLGGAKSRSVIKKPKHIIRQANEEEREAIKKQIELYLPQRRLPVEYIYERDWVFTEDSVNYREIEELRWKYYILAFDGSNTNIGTVNSALALLDNEIRIAFTIIETGFGKGIMANYSQLTSCFDWLMPPKNFFTKITAKDTRNIVEYSELITAHDNEIIDIRTPIAQLVMLLGTRGNQNMRYLNYFAILESLLTHSPKPSDPYDSITRQVTQKMNLLNSRFKEPVKYNKYVGDMSKKKTWQKMYACRSAIAHGGIPEFDSGDLLPLKNIENAIGLLGTAVKRVVIQALIEPQLIKDLKDC